MVDQLKSQNIWLRNSIITVNRQYKVENPRGGYFNAIINCEMDVFKKATEKGAVILGFAEKKVYEHVDLMQCFRCQNFGHISKNCNSTQLCRNYGGDHEAKCETLGETPTIPTILNCVNA